MITFCSRAIIYIIFMFFGCSLFGYNGKPDSSKECSVCHFEWMPEFVSGKGTEIIPYQKEKVVADEKMCFSCHNGTVGDSRIKIWTGDKHKLTDKIPDNIKVPNYLPLDNGKIACRTCHSAHGTKSPRDETLAESIFLRVKNSNSELCISCHKENKGDGNHPFERLKDNAIVKRLKKVGGKIGENGNVICESCHVPHSPKEKKLLIYYVTDSKICSICHIDKINSQFEYIKGMLNHPINIQHTDQAELNELKKSGAIYAKENEIICLTCHKPHQGKGKGLLVIDNKKDTLCLKCHNDHAEIKGTPHDMNKVKGFKTQKGKSPEEVGVCGSCHDPHGWSLKLPDIKADLITKGCIGCHNKDSYASKKIIDFEKFNHPIGKEIKENMVEDGTLPLVGEMLKYFTEYMDKGSKKRYITCATCHNVHSNSKNFLRKEIIDGSLCLTCHNEKKIINNTGHGSKKIEKSCLSCHKIHNSDSKRLLYVADNDGCFDCHKENGSASKFLIGKHSHPYNVVPKDDIKKPFKLSEAKLSCVTCHDPHINTKKERISSDFIRGGFESFDDFCTACHEKEKAIIKSDHDLKNENKANKDACLVCHKVHNAETDKYIMAIKYNYQTDNDYCQVCHLDKDVAGKKLISGGHPTGIVKENKNYVKYLAEQDGKYILSCISCHSAHLNGPAKGDEGNFKKSFLRKLDKNVGDKNICLICHNDKLDLSDSKHSVFKFKVLDNELKKLIESGNECGVCHVTHNSGKNMLDKRFVKNRDLCLDCHNRSGLASDAPVISSHPLDVKIDKDIKFGFKSDKVECTTCHEPHKKTSGMIVSDDKNICIVCHKNMENVYNSEHNLSKIDYIDEDIKRMADKNVCYPCHAPHNFQSSKYMWRFNNKSSNLSESMCLDCHNDKGIAYKKVPKAYRHEDIFKIFPYTEKYKEFLFDANGKTSVTGSISCLTCHDPHIWGKSSNDEIIISGNIEGNLENSFLKVNVKDGFCSVCHGEESESLFNKFHDDVYRSSRDKEKSGKEVIFRLLLLKQKAIKEEQK